MKKKILFIGLCILLLCVSGIVIIKVFFGNREYKNTNPGVTSNKEVSKLLFSDIEFTYHDGYTYMHLFVTNNNEQNVIINTFIIEVYDKNNTLIGTFDPFAPEIVNVGGKIEKEFSINADYRKADKIEIKVPNLEFTDKVYVEYVGDDNINITDENQENTEE